MRKFHFFFALLLTGVWLLQGCGEKIEDDIPQIKTYSMSVVATKGEIGTKALDLTNGTLKATWKSGEKVTVYNKTRSAELEGYLAAQGSGVETTLNGTITGVIGANDVLTLKFLEPNYSEQDGTLASIAAKCDCSTAEVTVKEAAKGYITTTGTANFTSQQAIVEFTLQESDGSAITGGVNKLTVIAGGTTITVSPTSATDVLYVAIPATSNGTLSLSAVDPNGASRSYSETGATFESGKFYKRGVKMDCLVMNDSDLFAANASQIPKIVLGTDIQITSPHPVSINGSMTIDLNGHSISGYAIDNVPSDRIFFIDKDKSLTLNGPGTLKNGHADEGGAIYNRGTLTLHDVTFTGCSASHGGAIYNEGTLNMSGTIVASDNIYLASGTVITVTGALGSGTRIGVTLANGAGTLTAGYSTYNGTTDPATLFYADDEAFLLSLSNGEVVLAHGRYDYTVTAEKTYATLQMMLDETGRDLSEAQSMLSILFPDMNSAVSAISYTYRSVDPQGLPVDLSAVLYIPVAALDGTKNLTGICLTNHGTIASNAECPTMIAQAEAALTWKNYAVVMPDYYGFGASADRPQADLDAETTARGNIDAYLAAVQLMEDREVIIPEKLYSFGYSQGGFNSMANLKYVSKHPELGVHFEKVMCGGSPFDVELTWDTFTRETFHHAIGFVPMTVISINESQQLGLDYHDLFKGVLLDNWRDWFLSKQYNLSTISDKIGTNDLSAIMNDDFMNRTGAAYNAILDVCRRYTLTAGWTPPSGTKIIIYHSKQDDTVPYANLAAMKTFFDQVAPGCYTAYDGYHGGHISAFVRFVLAIISEW